MWGRIAHGRVKAGDAVQLFPSGQTATVAQVRLAGEVVDGAEAGQSAGVVLDRQLDVSRGDWIATPPKTVHASQRFSATLAWLDTEPAQIGRKYWVRHGNRWVQARITAIESRLDIHTLASIDAHELAVNEMGHVVIETQQPLPVEAYETNRVGRRADRGRPGQQPHQRRAAGEGPRRLARLEARGWRTRRVVFIGAGPGRGRPDHAARRATAGAG